MVLRNLLIGLGVIALVSGIVMAASWFVRSRATVEMSSQAAEVVRSQSILTAARRIASGTLLQPADIAWTDIAPDDIAPGNIVRNGLSETAFLGAIARRDFAVGEPLIVAALVKPEDREFLAAVLSPGNRAVSIAVDAPQGAAGLVLPGDQVDVILTQTFSPEAADAEHKTVGETVLTNVRVIAVDQRLHMAAKPVEADKATDRVNSLIPRTITLEVSVLEAERLLVAVQLGTVYLSVRALEDPGVAERAAEEVISPVWASDVSPALRVLRSDSPAPPAATGTPPRTRTAIEVMRGSKIDVR